jgi:putative endonuclease
VTDRRSLGRLGEGKAEGYLVAQGYRILERNWRSPSGEVDLIAAEGEVYVFVEVKLRRGRAFGAPEEAVTAAKQERLAATAWAYLDSIGETEADWRIDVVAIEVASTGRVLRFDHYRNAVEELPGHDRRSD